ncbi:hypothetical protein BDR26DRAFT_565056 [Obelidium mucronatum]|nr:hypothetical protein BDR26DRAFT_565056 [Obelidium mucronatum]
MFQSSFLTFGIVYLLVLERAAPVTATLGMLPTFCVDHHPPDNLLLEDHSTLTKQRRNSLRMIQDTNLDLNSQVLRRLWRNKLCLW